MAKAEKSIFHCQQCGYESSRWLGRCPDCGEWNSFLEETERKDRKKSDSISGKEHMDPLPINMISIDERKSRYHSGIDEFDRVLGGGIVPGSLILLGGEPGIGKSTLLLQIANSIGKNQGKVLYVSAEESPHQIKLRATRLGKLSDDLFLLSETDFESIEKGIYEINPRVIMVDSIQTIHDEQISSAAGSISQIRECTYNLIQIAKSKDISIFIVGHVTKDGMLAGPKVLEHIVDTVLYLEGEHYNIYRILRSTKNRFGSTNELGIFEMSGNGLMEIANPSKTLISERTTHLSGSVIAATFEGSRPILVEIQSLVSYSNLNFPRRMTTGVDYNRVLLILAVLEKRIGFKMQSKDIHVNIAGGIKILEPALDLAIFTSIASSYKDIPIHPKTAIFGEIGLAGEVRMVNQTKKRIQEIINLNFERCIIPYGNIKNSDISSLKKDIEIIGVRNVKEAIRAAFR